ncbi:TonB-dependent receptor plug domain-containing protein [uncultured Maribacter sp.]|uniref:TonB-dependent receptor plug domain-containing protein n=1 Tax=uncultured Maribacter sp. TaxID=431308 RepID=UPI00262C2EAF|nr:TonB-dependent receptor plug domain-containing protein [uncultured Maribacter sp.]
MILNLKPSKFLFFLFFILINIRSWSQNNSNNITICWDSSFSMIERDLEKEFEILDKIFQRTPNLTVQLLVFNINVTEQKIVITNGDWLELKEQLSNIKADGATIYAGLKNRISNETVYYFTDGNTLDPGSILPIKKGNIIINTVANRNKKFLESSALIGKGRLMDLAAILPTNINKDSIQSTSSAKDVNGTVYIDNIPSGDIELRVKGATEVFRTNKNGQFTIVGVPGDSILITSRVDRTMKTVPIGYFNSNVDVFLDSNVMTLDEVVVSERRLDTFSENIINIATGLQNSESIGYAVQSMGDEEITPIQTDLNQSIQGRFSNVNVGPDQDLTQFTGRNNNTLLGNKYGLVVVDGMPIQQSNSSNGFRADASFINPENVADITVLKGLSATNRYGSLGINGVILITTKSAGKRNNGSSNSALATNNIYDPNVNLTTEKSPILKALSNVTNLENAYDQYLILRNFNETDDSFYLDAFSFFKDTDKDIAAKIISNFWEKDPKNEAYLRITELAMRYLGFDEVSVLLNRQLNELKPLALQPFFTEAKLKLAKSEKQEALDMLINLENGGAYGNLNVQPIQKSIERELKNLIFRDRSQLDVTKVKEKYFSNSKMNVRLLVEWSNPKSEFQIQFVNPQNRFFNWEHTTSADAKRIQDEVELGFAMEEFELYEDIKGEWIINATYIGNLDQESTMPLVLLCTVYTNFGYPSQSEEKIILHLTNENDNKKVVSLKI